MSQLLYLYWLLHSNELIITLLFNYTCDIPRYDCMSNLHIYCDDFLLLQYVLHILYSIILFLN